MTAAEQRILDAYEACIQEIIRLVHAGYYRRSV